MGTQTRPGPPNVHLDQSCRNGSQDIEESVSQHRIKPWSINREHPRNERIYMLASNIMANEAMEIINEVYEIVFEGNTKQKTCDEDA